MKLEKTEGTEIFPNLHIGTKTIHTTRIARFTIGVGVLGFAGFLSLAREIDWKILAVLVVAGISLIDRTMPGYLLAAWKGRKK